MLLPLQQNNLLDTDTVLISINASGWGNPLDEARVIAGFPLNIFIDSRNDTFVAAGAAFDAIRQDIIDGISSAQSEEFGWNAQWQANEVVTAVVRSSNDQVTVNLTASPLYDIHVDEVITVTIPASALTTSTVDVIATPIWGVAADTDEVSISGKSRRKRKRYVVEVDDQIIEVENIAQAEAVLAQTRALATESAEQDVTSSIVPKPPRVSVKTVSGNITTSKVIQREVRRTQQVINRAYIEAAKRRETDLEIAGLIHIKLKDEDDEDSILALLL